MQTAAKVLIVGGLLNLAYGAVTGFFFAAERASKPFASRYLVMAHTGPFLQGPMLLGLVFATELSPLNPGAETVAAFLLVAGSVLIAAKDTANWLLGINDEFAERPPTPHLLGALGVFAFLLGLSILLIGAVLGL